MRLTEEQAQAIKDQVKAGIATLTPEQVIKFGFAMFAFGAVIAEGLLNNRERVIAAKERDLDPNRNKTVPK